MIEEKIEEMGQEISNAIMFKLRSAGLETDDIDFNEIVDRKTGALRKPVINISINSGDFKSVTMTTYKQLLIISMFVMIQNLRGEKYRRYDAYLLVTQIAKCLLLQKLNLPLQDALFPVNFKNVTDDKYASAGFVIYQLDFKCSFNVERVSDEIEYGMLKTIVNDYYVHPNDDGVSDQNGIVTVVGIYGGGAYSAYKKAPCFGGHANTRYVYDNIYGGNARSTY